MRARKSSRHRQVYRAAEGLAAALWLATIAVALFLGMRGALGAAGDGRAEWTTQQITIRKGDSLWRIAARHTPPGGDPRATLHAIRMASHLGPAGVVRPGDRVLLPIRRQHANDLQLASR